MLDRRETKTWKEGEKGAGKLVHQRCAYNLLLKIGDYWITNPTPNYKIENVNTDHYTSYLLQVNLILCGNFWNLFLDPHFNILVLFSKNCLSFLVTSTRVPFIKVTNSSTSLTNNRLSCLLLVSFGADGVHWGILTAKGDHSLQASVSPKQWICL